MGRRRRIPAFGNWDYDDELPITQYFESAAQAGLIRDQCLSGDDKLCKPEAAPVKPVGYHSEVPQPITALDSRWF